MSILLNASNPVHSREIALATDGPKILIVDDDAIVREVLARYLRAHQFCPLQARSGEEALSLFKEHRAEISVVLLDVRMPGLDGPNTLALLQQIDPEVRACFMSGDLGSHTADDLHAAGALHLFAKPFALRDLVTALRQLTG